MYFKIEAKVSLFLVHFNKIGNVTHVPINKAFYLDFAEERIKRHFPILNVSEDDIRLRLEQHVACELRFERARSEEYMDFLVV
jgi:hypothetical protein